MFDQQIKDRLNKETQARLPWLEELYKHFHANPELSGKEEKTAARLAQELEALGLEVHSGIGGHGVVGVIKNGDGPTVLIRGDMDALPIKEITGLPFASQAVGISHEGQELPVMHACGHDVHTTNLAGVAAVLSELKDLWRGTVWILGQPAEEAIGGANLMMKDGLYERLGRPDAALALHVDPTVPTGSVSLAAGVQSSCSNSLDITVKGKGGHGASPQRTKDPVLIASHLVMALQSIVSREVKPTEMAVITVGAIHGGTKRNIIPEEVLLNLTVRAYDAELGNELIAAIKRTAMGVALSHGLPEELYPVVELVDTSYPPIINDEKLTGQLTQVFEDVLGEGKVEDAQPLTGSEDFSFFGFADPPVPTVMYRLGVTPKEKVDEEKNGGAKITPVHDPRFFPQLEGSMATAVVSMSAAALSILDKA